MLRNPPSSGRSGPVASPAGEFVAGTRGPLFVLFRKPPAHRGCVVVVPPFAEEMNKCRQLVTQVSSRLASHGVATVLVDLFGTGDSGGDFSEADWSIWQDDLARVARICGERGIGISGLLAPRLGAALAAAAIGAGRLPAVSTTVLWQPVFDGRRFLQQFLRMRIAAGLAEDRKEKIGDLQARLAAGEVVEVAGYGLSGSLAAQIGSLEVPAILPTGFGTVTWIEIVREAGAMLPAPVTQLVDASMRAGRVVAIRPAVGDPFWAATEILDQPEVLAATVQAFVPEAGQAR